MRPKSSDLLELVIVIASDILLCRRSLNLLASCLIRASRLRRILMTLAAQLGCCTCCRAERSESSAAKPLPRASANHTRVGLSLVAIGAEAHRTRLGILQNAPGDVLARRVPSFTGHSINLCALFSRMGIANQPQRRRRNVIGT